MRSYFGIHNHTHYSNIRLLDSINRPQALIDKAIELGLSGIAITDHECLSAHMEVNQYAKKLQETNPDFTIALGNEIYLTETRQTGQKYYHFLLLAKDAIGHKALRELSSIAWINSYIDRRMERVPTLKSELKDVMSKYKGHVIATTACIGGELGSCLLPMYEANLVNDQNTVTNYSIQIMDFINYCIEVFGEDDFYLECAPSNKEDQMIVNRQIYKISQSTGLKMVIGTDSHYLTKEDRAIHKAYLNSKEGEREVDDFYSYAHLMDDEEAFSNLSDIYSREEFDEICRNSLEIRDKIGEYKIFHNPIIPQTNLPDYPKMLPEEVKDYSVLSSLFASDNIQEKYWVNQCWESLKGYKLVNNKYLQRLETEADIIKTVGDKLGNCLFAYFNTFQNFINLFWDCGSIVGPGRGSAVCFLSNYLLGITQLDPVQWGLAEWRFLNKERLELPD